MISDEQWFREWLDVKAHTSPHCREVRALVAQRRVSIQEAVLTLLEALLQENGAMREQLVTAATCRPPPPIMITSGRVRLPGDASDDEETQA